MACRVTCLRIVPVQRCREAPSSHRAQLQPRGRRTRADRLRLSAKIEAEQEAEGVASTSGRREPHYENDADPDPQPEFSVIDFTGSRRNDVGDVLMDYRGSLNLLGRSLLDVESTFSVLLSLVTVAACHAHNLENDSPGLNANPNGGFLSFAVVFPLTFSLAEAFKRRETALMALSQVKGTMIAFFHGCRDWDWPSGNKFAGGRSALPPDFMAQTRRDLIELAWAQKELLLLPITSRTRTLAAKDAEAERARSAAALRRCDDRVAAALDSLSMAVETMKAAGMPGTEASRLRQYIATLIPYWELLRSLKKYRTPQMTRAFSRIYALLHPLFMGPYYAHVAGTVSDVPAVSLTFALGLAIATSLCLSALFSTRYRLEDPFAEGESDTVNVREEFGDLIRKLSSREEQAW